MRPPFLVLQHDRRARGRPRPSPGADGTGMSGSEFVPTALPHCWPAGQSGHAGHGAMWIAGRFVDKGQFIAGAKAVVVTGRGVLDHFAQQGASSHGMVLAQNRCHAS